MVFGLAEKRFLIALLPGIVTAVITAWLTVALSLKKFRSEKIWERKIDNYTNILKAIVDLQLIINTYVSLRKSGREVSTLRTDDFNEKMLNCAETLDAAVVTGAFTISNFSMIILNELSTHAATMNSTFDEMSLESLIELQQHVAQAKNAFREAAKKDLQM